MIDVNPFSDSLLLIQELGIKERGEFQYNYELVGNEIYFTEYSQKQQKNDLNFQLQPRAPSANTFSKRMMLPHLKIVAKMLLF